MVLEDDQSMISGEIGMLRERCRLLREKFRAVYYEDPGTYDKCSDLGLGKIQDAKAESQDRTTENK